MAAKATYVAAQIRAGKKVAIACMGGHGRTGYFAAHVLGLLGYDDPIGMIREEYCHKAIESKAQVQAVADFFGHPEWVAKYPPTKQTSYSTSVGGYGGTTYNSYGDMKHCYNCAFYGLGDQICKFHKVKVDGKDPSCEHVLPYSTADLTKPPLTRPSVKWSERDKNTPKTGKLVNGKWVWEDSDPKGNVKGKAAESTTSAVTSETKECNECQKIDKTEVPGAIIATVRTNINGNLYGYRVRRCRTCNRFKNDPEAARAVADQLGGFTPVNDLPHEDIWVPGMAWEDGTTW